MTEQLLEVEVLGREYGWNLTRGVAADFLRVRYREAGARRWRSFVIERQDGQTWEQLEASANEAAQRLASGAAA